MERSLQIMQPLKRLPWLLAQPKMTLFPSCKFYSWTCFWEKNYHQTRGREGREEGIVWKVKQDSERCGKTTDQPSVSPYSFSFSPACGASSPPASWLLPPPGAADTCGNSPPPPPQTCWGRRRPRSARRKWSRGASTGCSSWLAAGRLPQHPSHHTWYPPTRPWRPGQRETSGPGRDYQNYTCAGPICSLLLYNPIYLWCFWCPPPDRQKTCLWKAAKHAKKRGSVRVQSTQVMGISLGFSAQPTPSRAVEGTDLIHEGY